MLFEVTQFEVMYYNSVRKQIYGKKNLVEYLSVLSTVTVT